MSESEGFNSSHHVRTRTKVNTSADRARDRAERVRATLAPRPEPHYPAPWRVAGAVAEGGALIVDANNQTVCRTMVPEVAEAIVLAVNTFAGVAE